MQPNESWVHKEQPVTLGPSTDYEEPAGLKYTRRKKGNFVIIP